NPFQKVLLGSSLLAGFHRRFVINLHLIDLINTAVVEVVFRQVITIFDIVFAHTTPPRKTRAIYSATERFEKRVADDFFAFRVPAGVRVRSSAHTAPPDAGWPPPPA